jgi:hypothetical protein
MRVAGGDIAAPMGLIETLIYREQQKNGSRKCKFKSQTIFSSSSWL